MRSAAIFLLFARICFSQSVGGNAADALAGTFAETFAPGSQAMLSGPGCCQTGAQTPAISFRATGQTSPIPAQILSATQYEVTFLVPGNLPVGDAEFTYVLGNETWWSVVPIVAGNFALFRTGTPGPLQAQNVAANGSVSLNGLANPAQPGQYVTLWGTGAAPVTAGMPAQVAQVTLGGIPQRVVFAGPSPAQAGLIQINFQVTGAVPDSCYSPLLVTYAGQTVTSFLSKTSDGKPCHHPFGLDNAALTSLDTGGLVPGIPTAVSTSINAASADHAYRSESGAVGMNNLDAAGMAAYFTPGVSGCSAGFGQVFYFGVDGTLPDGMVTLSDSSNSIRIDSSAYSTDTFQGNGYSGNVPPSGDSPLAGLPNAVFSGGAWTWSASGIMGFGAGSFNFTLPPPIRLNIGAPLVIARNQNQTIQWDGSGYDANAVVNLVLTQLTAQPPGYDPGAAVNCMASAQSGSVTIPAKLMAGFAAGAFGSIAATVTETGAGIPHAYLPATGVGGPGGAFLALILWSSSDTRPVDFQ